MRSRIGRKDLAWALACSVIALLGVVGVAQAGAGNGGVPGVDCVDVRADSAPPDPVTGAPRGDCRFTVADIGYAAACMTRYGAAVPVSGFVACVGTYTPVTDTPTATPSATNTPVPTATNTNTPTATPTTLATRDKLLQPFASTSVWNHPIGSGASYVPGQISIGQGFAVENALVILAPTAPARTIYAGTGEWWPGAACNTGMANRGTFPIPDGYIVPAPPSGGDGTLPNRPGGVLAADGATIYEFQYATRCSGTGALTAGAWRCSHSIYGSGLCSYGAQGGSALSGVGGVLRNHELTGTIPHALKITLPADELSNCSGGYRWPATTADGYHDDQYVGNVCALRMGSLVALLPSYNCSAHSGLAARVCQALKDYGAYVGDTHPGWDPVSIIGEYGASAAALDGAEAAIVTMTNALNVVDNNGSANVGGGGTPRVPLAPAIGN